MLAENNINDQLKNYVEKNVTINFALPTNNLFGKYGKSTAFLFIQQHTK